MTESSQLACSIAVRMCLCVSYSALHILPLSIVDSVQETGPVCLDKHCSDGTSDKDLEWSDFAPEPSNQLLVHWEKRHFYIYL